MAINQLPIIVTADKLTDPARMAFAEKVSVQHDAAITAKGSKFRQMVRVEVHFKDGGRMERTLETSNRKKNWQPKLRSWKNSRSSQRTCCRGHRSNNFATRRSVWINFRMQSSSRTLWQEPLTRWRSIQTPSAQSTWWTRSLAEESL